MLEVLLLVLPDAAPPDGLAEAVARESIALLADARDAPVTLVWSGPDPDDAQLARVCARPRPLLLGCAPSAPAELCERALAAGFDDFIAGRFSPREIGLRLRALAQRAASPPSLARRGGVSFDAWRHELVVNGRRVALTRLELRLVASLFAAPGRMLTRRQLVAKVWGADRDVSARAVQSLVLRLRGRLRDPSILRTVRGVGVRLVISE